VHLHTVTVELNLVEPAFTLGQAVTPGRQAGRDERETQHRTYVAWSFRWDKES
jgi:hypothetical protein